MKITLSNSNKKIFAIVTSWDDANIAAKSILKRQYWSDLYYSIEFENGKEISGSIDLEPNDFHKPHQSNIITTHLKTFWGNVSRLNPSNYYGYTEEDINECKTLLNYLP